MKPFFLLFLLTSFQPVLGQMDIPGNPMVGPKGFETRSTGGRTDTGATVKPSEKSVRYVTHVVLFEYRMWSNTEGKPLEAKLLAFEDLIAEAPTGTTPEMPAPPAHPTVVRNGNVRLLVEKKAVVIPLSRLSESDREFVAGIEAALAKKADREPTRER